MGVTPVLVLLAGASGTGKSRLCARLAAHPPEGGTTVVRLDDFYLPGDTPGLPTTSSGEIDWDDPGSWDGEAAATSLRRLQRGESVEVPDYDLATSTTAGRHRVEPHRLVVAEGLFADTLLDDLGTAGAVCVCLDRPALLVAVQRLVRDVREHRKPLPVLLQRGWRLYRHHGDVVRRAIAGGAGDPLRPRNAEDRIRRLCASAVASAG